MEFFGLTYLGPQHYIKDIMREDYREPMNTEEAKSTVANVLQNTTCPKEFTQPDMNVIRILDCYIGRVDGFAYGSNDRFQKMKRKYILKPLSPVDMYRIPPTTSIDIGWFLCDPALVGKTWYKTYPRFPIPRSPNTLILDAERKNNKYASLF